MTHLCYSAAGCCCSIHCNCCRAKRAAVAVGRSTAVVMTNVILSSSVQNVNMCTYRLLCTYRGIMLRCFLSNIYQIQNHLTKIKKCYCYFLPDWLSHHQLASQKPQNAGLSPPHLLSQHCRLRGSMTFSPPHLCMKNLKHIFMKQSKFFSNFQYQVLYY